MKSLIIKACGIAAVVGGTLRVLTSVLPATTGKMMTLYLIIDLLLLFGCVGLYQFQWVAVRLPETLGVVLEIVGALILIARDLALLKPEAYPTGALLFAVGLDLFAIGSWKRRTFARWILVFLILSTVIGPIGFFIPGLAILFAASGILFGIGFAGAGVSILRAG